MEPDRGALLAIGMNGEALPPEHGFPVRMVVPGLYGFVSATKWIADMELTTFDAKQAYWLRARLGRAGADQDPVPDRQPARVRAGRRPDGSPSPASRGRSRPGIGGSRCGWTAGRGRTAELSTEVNGDTWRMWRAEFDLAPGSHTVQTRATDRDRYGPDRGSGPTRSRTAPRAGRR